MSPRQVAMETFLARTEASFDEALAAGLPPFPMHPRDSNPVNATPYMLRYSRFRSEADRWIGRGRLLAELDAVMAAVQSQDLVIEAILVGGSFTDLDKPAINDIDCLIFYRVDAAGGACGPAQLGPIGRDAKARGIDARFVPLDGDPLALIKLTAYFSILYSKHRDRDEVVRGLLLLDCRESA